MNGPTRRNDNPWAARTRWVFGGFLLVGAFFLLAEHRAHMLPFLPWLILLACPLMHIFMHGGHRGPGGHRHDRTTSDDATATPSGDGSPQDHSRHRGRA